MKDVLSSVRRAYPAGFYFRDLTISSEPNWMALAAVFPDPLLFRIHSWQLSGLLEGLIAQGIGPSTPCVVFMDARQSVAADLATVAIKLRQSAGSDMFLLVAEDAHRMLSSRGRLSGKRVLITRARSQASDLATLLEEEGATVLEIPTIEIVLQNEGIALLKNALASLDDYSWLLLTSVNSVSILSQVLLDLGMDWKVFDRLSIACIGSSTAAAVKEKGANVDLVPPAFQAESLVAELILQGCSGKRFLLPRAAGSRPVLPETLRKNGAIVDEIHIYRAEKPEGSRAKLLRLLKDEPPDFITFTSSSTVHHFMEMTDKDAVSNSRIISIGPITTATLKEYGLVPAAEAKEFTMAGLVEAMCAIR